MAGQRDWQVIVWGFCRIKNGRLTWRAARNRDPTSSFGALHDFMKAQVCRRPHVPTRADGLCAIGILSVREKSEIRIVSTKCSSSSARMHASTFNSSSRNGKYFVIEMFPWLV
jgi:hypothetical protein